MTTSTQVINSQTQDIRILSWFKNGFSLFLKAPFKLFLFLLAALVVEGIFQLLPTSLNIPISKIVMIIISAALWPILAQLHSLKKFQVKSAFSAEGWKQVLFIAPVFLLPFVSQLMAAFILLGEQGVSLLLFGELMPVSPLMLGLIFASGAPAIVLLTFVIPRIMLKGEDAFQAIGSNFNMLKFAWREMSVLLLINALILLLAPISFALSALLLGPVLVCVNYIAYDDIVKNDKG